LLLGEVVAGVGTHVDVHDLGIHIHVDVHGDVLGAVELLLLGLVLVGLRVVPEVSRRVVACVRVEVVCSGVKKVVVVAMRLRDLLLGRLVALDEVLKTDELLIFFWL
jgi:hypothetical protein